MSTQTQLRDRLKIRFRDTNAEINDDTYYVNLINEGYEQVISASPFWPFLEVRSCVLANSAGGNSFALPADAWRVLSIFNLTNHHIMSEITGLKTFVEMYPDLSNATGDPFHYRVFNNTVELYPWPTSVTTFQVEYSLRPTALTAGTSPVFPSQFHDILVEYALWKAYEDDSHMTLAGEHKANFAERLAGLIRELTEPRGDSYAQISDNWY